MVDIIDISHYTWRSKREENPKKLLRILFLFSFVFYQSAGLSFHWFVGISFCGLEKRRTRRKIETKMYRGVIICRYRNRI